MLLRCLPSNFGSTGSMVWEEMSFEDFQDGHHGHLGYLNGTILSILHLCVTVMLSTKFWLNPTYGLGDVVRRSSRCLPWRPTWISEWNNFSNSEFLCCSNASHQVLAQSHLRFGRRCRLKYFKMAAIAIRSDGMVAILDIGTERF